MASTDSSATRARATERLWVVLSLATLYVVWSSTYLALRLMVEGLPALTAGGARYFTAGLVLLLLLRAKGAALPTARQWLLALPVGALMFLVGNGFVAIAEKHVSSGIAAVACASMPLWAAVLGSVLGARSSRRDWAGLVIGFVGVVALFAGAPLRAEPSSALLLAAAPVGWAVGSLLARRLPLPSGLMSAATQMIAGGVVMMVVGPLMGEELPASPPVKALVALAYLVVLGSVVAFSAYSYLLRTTRPAVAMSYAYVNPVLAVLLGAVFAGEAIGPSTVLGTLLIAAGVLVVMKR